MSDDVVKLDALLLEFDFWDRVYAAGGSGSELQVGQALRRLMPQLGDC